MTAADRQAKEFREHALAVATAMHTADCEACLRDVAAYLRGQPGVGDPIAFAEKMRLLQRIETLTGGGGQ